jgi:hypothetical protein
VAYYSPTALQHAYKAESDLAAHCPISQIVIPTADLTMAQQTAGEIKETLAEDAEK